MSTWLIQWLRSRWFYELPPSGWLCDTEFDFLYLDITREKIWRFERIFLSTRDQFWPTFRERIQHHDDAIEKDPERIRFRIIYDKDQVEDILSYNEILEYIERENNSEDGPLWQYRRLVAHQHTPLNHPDRNGSEYNVQVEWENGEVTSEPLDFLAKDIPVDLAMYAKEQNLLNLPGWKRFKRIAKRE